MQVTLFSIKHYEQVLFEQAITTHVLNYIPESLSLDTVKLAKGSDVVCCFVTDSLSREIIEQLKDLGVKAIVLRSAGYDHVDLNAAKACHLPVLRVPGYSPSAIAEFAIGLILTLSRKILLAHDRVKDHNFSLEGLAGFNIKGKTVGIIGTGKIGTEFAKIIKGFSCTVLANDIEPSQECKALGVEYVTKDELYNRSDIISLHCPLNESTKYVIGHESLNKMKQGVMIINTGRGGLIDTKAVIKALTEHKIGALGIDVYEKEKGLFFSDHTNDILADEDYAQLEQFSNVLITGHQAFLSVEALLSIVNTTLDNITYFEQGKLMNQVIA